MDGSAGSAGAAATARRRVRAWYLFDWANQPYNTLLLTFVFAPYFASAVAPDPVTGQALWGTMLAVTGGGHRPAGPGARRAGRQRGAPAALAVAVLGALLRRGLRALVGGAGGRGAGLDPARLRHRHDRARVRHHLHQRLPARARPRPEIGRVSGTGWALGYAGGVVSLALVLLFLAEGEGGRTLIGLEPAFGLDPAAREGTRAVGPFTALWYAVFVIPFFLWVRDPVRPPAAPGALARGLADLGATLRSLPRRRSLFAWLGSSMFSRDALNGIYAFGGIYAAGVLGWSITQIGVFGITAAVVGAVACWLGGRADRAFGPKPVIVAASLALIGVCLIVLTTSRGMVLLVPVGPGSSLPDAAFFLCGAVIGAAGGILQAASRTMMVRQADPARMTEAFGLYALSGKATAFLAPALVAFATAATGDQRLGVAPLILLFLSALVLLSFVKPDGERAETWAASSPSS